MPVMVATQTRSWSKLLSFFAALAGLAFGCGDDPPRPMDAGADAAPRPMCPLEVGGHPACNVDCPWPCDEGFLCSFRLCLPAGAQPCSLDFEGSGWGHDRFCRGSEVCGSTSAPSETGFDGVCVSEEFCRDTEGNPLGIDCWYPDMSSFEDGPEPEASCPPAPHPTTPFCGGPCGGCPDVSDEDLPLEPGCAGRNEERDLGVCVFTDQHCDVDRPLGLAGVPDERPDELPGLRDTVCLVYRDNPRFEENGWLPRRASCLAYRERYPDAVECMDAEWEPLP